MSSRTIFATAILLFSICNGTVVTQGYSQPFEAVNGAMLGNVRGMPMGGSYSRVQNVRSQAESSPFFCVWEQYHAILPPTDYTDHNKVYKFLHALHDVCSLDWYTELNPCITSCGGESICVVQCLLSLKTYSKPQ